MYFPSYNIFILIILCPVPLITKPVLSPFQWSLMQSSVKDWEYSTGLFIGNSYILPSSKNLAVKNDGASKIY